MTTTAETLAGLAVAASFRFSQDRAAPSDVSDPGRAESERGDDGLRVPSAPSTPVGAEVRQDGFRLRAAFNSIDSTAARVSGSRESEFPDSPSSAPQALVGASFPDGAPARLHGAQHG